MSAGVLYASPPNKKTVIILGNGFDLSLNLSTGYNHFIESKEFENLRDNYSNTLAHDIHTRYNSTRDRWIDLELLLIDIACSPSCNPNAFTDNYYQLIECLSIYLKRITSEIPFDPESPAIKFLNSLNRGGTVYECYNFNYSKTVDFIINKLNIPSTIFKTTNIHGTLLANDIILGAHDECPLPKELTFIKKSHSQNFKGDKLLSSLANTNNIVFFGHSLGRSDHFYFQNHFKTILSQSKKKSNITIYTKNKASEHAVMSEIDEICEGKIAALKSKMDFTIYYTT